MIATTQDTAARWESVIADLTVKANNYDNQASELSQQRDALTLDAELGQDGAARQLTKLLNDIAVKQSAASNARTALRQAQHRLEEARKAEAEIADRQRQAELSRLATVVIQHAAEFTDALRQAVKAGAALKLVIQNMLNRAGDGERPNLDRILQRGPFQRCAEFAGLNTFVEFQKYPGPRDQVVALEDELSVYLGKWLDNANGKE